MRTKESKQLNNNYMPAVSLDKSTSPKMEELFQKLQKNNDQYTSLLSQLETSLHKILDKRQPEKKSTETPVQPSDAISAINQQVYIFELENEWLARLIDHIQEIV